MIMPDAGNPIARTADDGSSQTLSFNNANRLDSINVNGGQTATYTYNPLGQRVVKELANGDKEIYLYDEAGQLIAVVDGAGNRLREYIYRDGKQVAMVRGGNIYYIHNDHLNTPQVITDANQQVVWMANYEPFGKLAANQTNSIEVYSRFPGQYLDSETGLYYNYFRDYDPSIGRYIESDPIGLGGGINTYGYVSQNPLKYIDPTGQNEAAVGVLAIGLVAVAVAGEVAASKIQEWWNTPSSINSVGIGPWPNSTLNPEPNAAGEEAAEEIKADNGGACPTNPDQQACSETIKKCRQKCMSKGEPGSGGSFSEWLGKCVLSCTSSLGCSNVAF